jgi:hypothetical protein
VLFQARFSTAWVDAGRRAIPPLRRGAMRGAVKPPQGGFVPLLLRFQAPVR